MCLLCLCKVVISSIICFSLADEPLLVISDNDLDSAQICISTARPSSWSSVEWSAKASSKNSANAITSPEKTDLAILRDLQLLNVMGIEIFVLSMKSIICLG